MYTVLVGVSLVCAAVFVAVMGLALVERGVSWELRRKHNNVAGFIYAVVGVTYAVLLGLVVIAVWGSYEAARNTAASEANELGEIFWSKAGPAAPERGRLWTICGKPSKGTSPAR